MLEPCTWRTISSLEAFFSARNVMTEEAVTDLVGRVETLEEHFVGCQQFNPRCWSAAPSSWRSLRLRRQQ